MEALELLLSIEGVAVHRMAESQEPIEVAKGQMDVFVQQPANSFLLRVDNATFPLSKDVQVVKGPSSSYMVLISPDMFCFSANPVIPEEVAEVLEMTFADSCQFIRESENRVGLEVVEVVDSEEVYPSVPQEGRLKQLLRRGKEKLKERLTQGTTLAFVTYLKAKVYLKKRLGKKKSVARPQEGSICLNQAVEMLKEMEKEAPPAQQVSVVDDILQSYGRMSQHLSQMKPPH